MTDILLPALLIALAVPVVLLVTLRLLTGGASVDDWTEDEGLPTGVGRTVTR